MIYLLSFAIGFLADFIWTKCVQFSNPEKGRDLSSSIWGTFWSLISHILSVVSILLIIEKDFWITTLYILGACFGFFIGIYFKGDSPLRTP